jgi:PAS domain S-box-containing protein
MSNSNNSEPPPRQIVDIAIEALNHIPAMVAYWDRNQVCRFANNAYHEWFGKTPEAVIGSSLQELLGPLYDLNLPYILRALQGEVQLFEREIPVHGGGTRHSLATYTPDIVDGVVRGFFVHVADVTSLKIVERALKESEERFKSLMEAAPDALIIVGPDGHILQGNAQTLVLFGYTREELYGQPVEMLLPERFRELHSQHRSGYFAEPRTRLMGAGLELQGLRKDGRKFPVEISLSPLETEDGVLVIAAVRDITEQKMMQEQLFESQKLESLGRLAGGVAHDFNNLLTAITGYTELAEMEVPSESEAAKFLAIVQSAAERASALTSQLLMYARRQMVAFTAVNLNKVILGMDPLMRRTINESYELVLALDERLWNVSTNASQMEQVLMNLIVNARDAMPNGGHILVETANVTLDAAYAESHVGVTPGEYAMFAVSDNGPGMAKETLARIFEPFFTTKAMGKGTGLGLATCYGIVKQSGGNIWVYSEAGKGTSFKIYLPRLREAPILEEAIPWDDLPSGTETILLVDDEPMVRDIAARILRSQGYRVLEASNGADALHIQSDWEGSIDLLVTDVVMPLMGGKELAQRLQQSRPDIKVLYMSGYTHNVILRQGVLKPDVALITKPFTSSDLGKKVREVLNG